VASGGPIRAPERIYDMAYVKFSKAAYDACDFAAKDIISRHLNKLGMYTLAEEKQDADVKALILHKDGLVEQLFYEGEIKSGWIDEWPSRFKTVHIPKRKEKLLKKHEGHPLKFWVISGDFKQAWEIDSSMLREEFLKEVPNTRKWSGEYFFCIPVEHCKLITIKENQ
jgi:hypothetical protein